MDAPDAAPRSACKKQNECEVHVQVRGTFSALDEALLVRQFQSQGRVCNQSVLSSPHVFNRPNRHVACGPMPSCRRWASRALTVFLFAMITLAAVIQSGCTGVTSAKGSSATSTTDSSASVVLGASPTALDFGNV